MRLLLAGALLLASPAAQAGTYVVRWTVVEHDLTPVRQVVRGRYVDVFTVDGPSVTTRADVDQATTAFGQTALFTSKLGTPYRVSYAMRGRSVVRTDAFPGFSATLVVTPSSPGACRARVAYRKAPGSAVFRSVRNDGSGPSTASAVDAADVTCAVTGS